MASHTQLSKWRNELTPNIVDHLAKVTPDSPYALYPNSPITYDEGYRTVTYKDLANAANGLAWWLNEALGPSTDFDVLAYIGPNDIRYSALMLAAIKVGYLAFFPSPRNSIAAHGALFEKTGCGILLTPTPSLPGLDAILSAHTLRHLQIPSVSELLEKVHPHYAYTKTCKHNKFDPVTIVHTSGSTGIPKPVTWTHESFSRLMNMMALEAPPGFLSVHHLHQGKRIMNIFPPFHAAAFGVGFINSLAFGTVSIAPLPGAIPSADGLVQALKAAPADVAFLIPLIAAELAQKPELLEFCSKHLEHIFYCGGHLPKEPGDVIAVKIPIHCQYGATELGFATQIISPDMTNTDWQYVRFHPEMGYEFEEVTPGLFELIVKRNPQDESNQLTFTMGLPLGDESVYRTRDLFEKHPTLPDTWAWRARADDIIVFLTGEKTNPITMEQHIVVKNEGVANAIVVGMQRFQAGLIVEPVASLGKLSPEDASAFIDKIWPSIEEANDFTPAHARVEKRMVMLTDPEKPILRSPKGSTLRQASLAQYTSEMDELYSKLDTELFGIKPARVNTQSAHDVFRFITHAINGINSNILNSQHDNIFSAGMDSLMAMQLVRALRHGLGDPSLDLSVIYNNPSVEKLAEHLNGDKSLEEERIAQFQNSEIYQIGAEYFKVIDKIRPPAPRPETLEFVVLTGSTGSLGTHLLQEFLANSNVGHVYCLNRRADASDVHAAKAKTTGFRLDEHRHRVSFIRSELAQPNLGLDATTYNMLLSTATLIVPNAWPVNFIMPLSAFRPEIDGLVNLFRFANSSEKRPKIFYISSVSSVANYSSSYTPRIVPELVIEGDRAPQDIGYAKSKLLAEILCELAALNLSIPVSFARVGQIAGPTRANNAGVWNTTEWLPSLILTSMSFGALPDDLGSELNTIDWMPVDLLAQALVELSTKPNEGSSAEVFNVVNPRATTWKDILPSLATSIEKHTNKAISVIPLQSWLGMLQKSVDEFTAGNASLAHTHPAIKLHKFYETAMLGAKGPIKWETENAMSTSETLREMPAVCEEWVDKWIQRWAADMTARRRDQVLTTLVSMGGLRR